MSKTGEKRRQLISKKLKGNNGLSLETTVARIQQMMDPRSVVTHNEKLIDRVGNERQYDVVIRGQFGGRDVLGIIECKDHNRKKGPDSIEAFAKKTENLNANFRLMVSRKGFTRQALNLAKHEGVGCISLLPDDPKQVGFCVGDMWYGRLHQWKNGYLTVFFGDTEKGRPEHGYQSRLVKWNGKPVIEWFERELFTKFSHQRETGEYSLVVEFDKPHPVEIAGTCYDSKAVACTVTRECQLKRKFVTWSGDAFYDWHEERFTVPPKGVIVGSSIDTTLADWDDYEGEIPTGSPGFVRMTLDCFLTREVPTNVADLETISKRASIVLGSPSSWKK